MKRSTRKALTVIVAAVSAVALTGCVGPTPEEQTTTLQYEGGKMIRTEPKFSACVQGGSRGEYDYGGKSYTYPGDQRVVDFQGGDSADRGPIRVKSNDGIEMDVYGTLQYNLNTDCAGDKGGVLGAFHQNIGRRYEASFTDGINEVPSGWRAIQRLYVETPMERTVVGAASDHTWFTLWKDEPVRSEVEETVNDAIAAEVGKDTPTDEDFYRGFRFSITRIEPTGERGEQVKQAIADGEKRTAEARANEQAAVANETAAIAQTKASIEQAKQRQAEIAGFGTVEQYNINQCINTPGCQPYVTVYGGSTVTTPSN